MKKLGILAIAVVIIVLLVQQGVVTQGSLLAWGEKAIDWTAQALETLFTNLEDRLFGDGQAEPTQGARYGTVTDEAKKSVLLVNADHPLPEGYEPESLVRLYDQKRHFLLARDDLYLTQEAFDAANRMFKAAEDENLNGFIVTSAYRSREKQQEVYETSEPGLAQKPGCSEHETGLAFDVTTRYDSGSFEDTTQCKWLMKHCYEYGFILRYPEGKENITGVAYEPWHYRYVGADIAREIHRTNAVLEEYLLR